MQGDFYAANTRCSCLNLSTSVYGVTYGKTRYFRKKTIM